MTKDEHDFIDEAVEKAYKKIVYKQTQRLAKINKRIAKRKMQRQNRKKGRK